MTTTLYPSGQKHIVSLTGAEQVQADAGGAVKAYVTTAQIAALAASENGTFVANGATPVVVADARVTANSVINFSLKTPGGTVGAYPAIQTITPGTGFTVAATALDTSTYNYQING